MKKGIYTIDDIMLALDTCKKFNIEVKTPPQVDGMLDGEVVTVEVKMFLHNLLLNNRADQHDKAE